MIALLFRKSSYITDGGVGLLFLWMMHENIGFEAIFLYFETVRRNLKLELTHYFLRILRLFSIESNALRFVRNSKLVRLRVKTGASK